MNFGISGLQKVKFDRSLSVSANIWWHEFRSDDMILHYVVSTNFMELSDSPRLGLFKFLGKGFRRHAQPLFCEETLVNYAPSYE